MNKIQQGFSANVCSCTLEKDETPVQSGLSYTPSQMRDMTKKGYPVAPPALSEDFFQDTDNRPGNNFEVDVWERRGTSINDCWEAQQDARHKIKKVHKDGAFQPVETSNE